MVVFSASNNSPTLRTSSDSSLVRAMTYGKVNPHIGSTESTAFLTSLLLSVFSVVTSAFTTSHASKSPVSSSICGNLSSALDAAARTCGLAS